MKFKSSIFVAITLSSALIGCGDINSSWEVKGGGYLKYKVDGKGPYTIELEKNDVEPPFYVNNQHYYFYVHTQPKASDRKDQFAILVNSPSTGKDLHPVSHASIGGKTQPVTWIKLEGSAQSPVISNKSSVHFDEIIKDSLWTANVDLYFLNCSPGTCDESAPPIHVTGRLRYWVPEDER